MTEFAPRPRPGRYAPGVQSDRAQSVVTLIGAAGILIGLFTCALASGLSQGDA